MSSEVDVGKRYFLMSFRMDKSKAEDFGLVPLQGTQEIFIDPKDGSEWESRSLYDLGWGKECGFMRLPKLGFDQLWYLLVHSKIQENRYGAAALLEEDFAPELLEFLTRLLSQSEESMTESVKDAFRILRLYEVRNRNTTEGLGYGQVKQDFANWISVSSKVRRILGMGFEQ